MPLTARQAPKGARVSRRKQLRKSNCRSTRGGVRVQGSPGTAMGLAPPPREGGAWERAPRLEGQSPAKWSLPSGGECHRGADRRSSTGGPVNLQRLKPDSGPRVPRRRDGRGQGSEWYHPREDDPLRAPHPLMDGGPGTGLDQSEGAKDREMPVEDGPRTDHHLRIQEERRAHFS
jgi:hypothetical protein